MTGCAIVLIEVARAASVTVNVTVSVTPSVMARVATSGTVNVTAIVTANVTANVTINATVNVTVGSLPQRAIPPRTPRFVPYADLTFDEYGQADYRFHVLQQLPQTCDEFLAPCTAGGCCPQMLLVYGEQVVNSSISFPTPTWARRACEAAVRSNSSGCGAHGTCQDDGSCLCDSGYSGADCRSDGSDDAPAWGWVVGAALAGLLLLWPFWLRERRYLRELRSADKSRARWADGSVVTAPKIEAGGYHVFVSHVWSSGQDQSRAIKQQLVSLVKQLVVLCATPPPRPRRPHRPRHQLISPAARLSAPVARLPRPPRPPRASPRAASTWTISRISRGWRSISRRRVP